MSVVRIIGALAFAAALVGASASAQAGWLSNWSVSEEAVATDEVRLTLRMLRVHLGGDGEARQRFAQRAAELARMAGYRSYLVLEYVEGIESRLPIAQRYATGVIRLIP